MKSWLLVLTGVLFLSSTAQAQKSQEDSVTLFRSFSSLQRMVQLYRQEKNPNAQAILFGLGTEKDPEPIPPEVEAQAQKLKQITQQEGCKIILPNEENISLGEGDMQSSVTAFHFEMSGEGCPLFMSMTLKAKKVDNKIEGEFSLEYKALNDEFKKESDISEILQKGLIFVEVTPGQTSQKMVLKVKISGAGISQKFGTFNVEHAMDTDFAFNFPMDIKATVISEHTFKFKQDNIQLKRDSRIEGIFSVIEKYYNNDQEIDLAQYSHLAQGIKFVGIGEKTAADLPPMACDLKLIDKSNAAVVATLSSCAKNASTTGFYKQDFYQLNLDFKENWVEGVVLEIKSGKTDIMNALYEEISDFKKDLGALQIQMMCQPVTKCP